MLVRKLSAEERVFWESVASEGLDNLIDKNPCKAADFLRQIPLQISERTSLLGKLAMYPETRTADLLSHEVFETAADRKLLMKKAGSSGILVVDAVGFFPR